MKNRDEGPDASSAADFADKVDMDIRSKLRKAVLDRST